ncbi:MAG: TonB-dependent receptor [Gemmatimonadota bacterium]
MGRASRPPRCRAGSWTRTGARWPTRVELRHAGTGAVWTTTSGVDGHFYLPNVRPGAPYTLEVARIGYRTATREEMRLRIGQTLEVEVRLTDEAVPLPELAVEIEADPAFDPSRMGAAARVDEPTLERVPTLTRDFVEFARLSPLVKLDEDGVSVAGANFRFNNIQVDGALNQDVFGLSPSGVAGGQAQGRVIPLGAIQELEVLIAPYDVRQSGFTGGVVNAVTRSGTNAWEGSAIGFARDESFVGDLVVDGVSRKPAELENLYAGFTLGGPLAKDRLHVFAAGEIERRRRPPDGFHVGIDDPVRTKLSPDSLARLEQLLEGYGVEAGSAAPFTLENDLANLFARIDVRLDDRNSAMLRYNYAGADDDPPPNRLPGEAYELSSNATTIESRNHSVVGQWLSAWSPSLSNELLLNVQFLRDIERPLSEYPRIEVDIASLSGENILQRRVRAGANFFAQRSELDQDILQLSNALTWAAGRHRLRFGGAYERFAIRRLYQPGSLGSYRFGSLDSLAANLPSRYDLRVPLSEGDPSVRFTVSQLAGFVQDEWRVGERLNVRFGVRVDVPRIGRSPAFNPGVAEDFGIDTSELPSGNPLFSPRGGFNLRLGEETQIRGGAGLFAGRPAFAWVANAFENTGLEAAFLTCENEIRNDVPVQVAPPFDPASAPPTQCLDGSRPLTPLVNVFDPDFRFPQDFKASVAIDQRLPLGFLGTLEAIYAHAVHQIFLDNLNLGDPVPEEEILHANGFTDGFAYGTRTPFGYRSRSTPWEASTPTGR